MSIRLLLCTFLAAAAVASPTLAATPSAAAHDKPAYGPPAAWVDVIPIPPAPPAEGAPAIQLLLDDHQTRLDPAGDAYYVRRVIKILKNEGLASLKTMNIIWSPDTESLTFHTMRVLRGDQVIDLLQDGKDMLVLRRERNLEQASLDGRLTASRQLEGLQTGDLLEFAYTRVRADPVVKGASFDAEQVAFTGVAGRYRTIVSWDKDRKIQWKATPGFGEPALSERDGRTVLVLDKSNIQAPKAPVGAPLRFRRVGLVEVSSFESWNDISKLMAPLYAKASDVPKTSPIRAEADAIAARTKDPRARAFAALQLVEDKTRYFFVGMGDGGYVPANADDTWARRLGDCKAKSALLLALLKSMGLDAEPVLVSLGGGDGINELPPALAAFNHVIVRVKINGQSYWLDGTRTGDTNISAMQPPGHKWGLPVRAEGAALEPIVERQITVPTLDTVIHIDASKGLDSRATARVELTSSGVNATAMRAAVAKSPKADLERAYRQQFSNMAGGMDVDDVNWRDDPASDRFTVELTGTMDMEWRKNEDVGMMEYKVATGQSAPRLYAKREPGPNSDAPFAVPYPSFVRARTEIVLPDGGKGYVVRGPQGAEKVGGFVMDRTSKLEGDTAVFSIDMRSNVPEISATEAEAANIAIRKLGGVDSLVRAPLRSAGSSDPARPG